MIDPKLEEYYWIKMGDEILIGRFEISFGWESWSICGSDEIIRVDEVEVLSHIERNY